MRIPLILLFILALGSNAIASPLRPLRTVPRESAGRAAQPSSLAPGRGLESVCGSSIDGTPEVLLEHLTRVQGPPLPTTYSTDVGEVAVLEDDGRFFYLDKNNNTKVDLASVAEAFYKTHGDDYQALAIYLSSGLSDWLGSVGALASATVIRNQIEGIGQDIVDYGSMFGSPANLEVLLNLNALHRYPADPAQSFPNDNFSTLDVLAHELGHRWLSYVWVDSAGIVSHALLGRDYQHWNFFFDSDSSYMEGNNWVEVAPDSFRTTGVVNGYGTLDLYLMGLMAKAEVDSFFTVNAPTAFDPPGTYIPGSASLLGLGCRGRDTQWTISDIEAVHGPRIPDAASSPHSLRVAFLLLTAHGSAPTQADLDKVETIRAAFAPTYATATRGRGSVNLALTHHAGTVSLAHTPLSDTENAVSPRPLGTRVTIVQGGIPLDVDASSVRAYWRTSPSGSFTPVALAPAGADSFAGALPAFPPGTNVQYYLYASSDSAGITATDPPAGPAAPHLYHVGPDLQPPVIVHHPVPQQSSQHVPQTLLARVTDNLGVDSVWVESTVDGGPLQSTAASPAGRDSFAVALGAGLASGHVVAYRFVARDDAAAHNLATSNAAFDTMRVGDVRVWDFENGGDGFVHGPQWYSYRDEWHLAQDPGAPDGGTEWACGSVDGTPYPPHLDANLYSPLMANLPAGSVLSFSHRYDLEEASPSGAWDGVRVEGQINNGPWQTLLPVTPYDHHFFVNSNPFQAGTPCWSGNSGGWRTETVDLSPLAPGPSRIRFRLLADDFLGFDGWRVDRIRVFPSSLLDAGGGPPPVSAIGKPWPNPARDALHLTLALARPATADWALYDVAGRKVAALFHGAVPRGGFTLQAATPPVAAGLYFARLTLDGRVASVARVALAR